MKSLSIARRALQFVLITAFVLGFTCLVTEMTAHAANRFIEKDDGTVLDNETGLMWLKDADFSGQKLPLVFVQLFNRQKIPAEPDPCKNLHYQCQVGSCGVYQRPSGCPQSPHRYS